MFGSPGGPSPGQRAAVVAAGVVQFALLGAALVDLRRRTPPEVKGPRWAWTLASFINFVGPIAYFAVGRQRGHGAHHHDELAS